ncbi:MAG: hypothetical protein ACLSVG_07800 [Clostridia bacterium]
MKIKKLVEYFKYLADEYGMNLIEKYLKGSFPYVIWSNGKKNIKVVFDYTDDKPMHIFVYDSDDFAMYSYKEFADELKYRSKSDKDIDGDIEYAARKFYELLKQDNRIITA